MTLRIALYSTSACHLCEEAAALLKALPQQSFSWHEIEISEDDTLLERYGLTIPVVKREDTQAELGWPFDREHLLAFLA